MNALILVLLGLLALTVFACFALVVIGGIMMRPPKLSPEMAALRSKEEQERAAEWDRITASYLLKGRGL